MLLLVLGMLCLGCWPILLKNSSGQWRFELFQIDFAAGALLLAALAAFTLGTLGPEVTFGDRLLLAGRTSQAWLVLGGIVFNIGNMLLIAAISLLGISGAVPLAVGLVLTIDSVIVGGGNSLFGLTAGVALLLAAIVSNIAACELREPSAAASANIKRGRAAQRRSLKRSTKGLIAAAAAGVFISPAYLLTKRGMEGDLALGPYGGVLMFSIGIVVSTGVFNFYFRNLPMEGPAIPMRKYLRTEVGNHVPGVAAGAIFMLGWLAEFLAVSGLPFTVPSTTTYEFLTFSGAVLACLLGLVAYKEFSAAPSKSTLSIWLATGFFFAGIVVLSLSR